MNAIDSTARAREIFRRHGGLLRTSQALKAGISRWLLYRMRDAGVIEPLERGLYRLTDLPPLGAPDLVAVARRVSHGVVCLVSALSVHDITTQIPHHVYLALDRERSRKLPRISHPPIQVFWFSGPAYSEGIEEHSLDNVSVRIYSPEKTIADCFKMRNRIGLDVALEALRFYRQRKTVRIGDLMHYAKVCRVEKVIRPYLEAVL